MSSNVQAVISSLPMTHLRPNTQGGPQPTSGQTQQQQLPGAGQTGAPGGAQTFPGQTNQAFWARPAAGAPGNSNIVLPPDAVHKPWKYVGYRGVSKWMASSEDGVIVRRFDQLHARTILYMQDQLVKREKRLEEIDVDCMQSTELFSNGSFREDMFSSPKNGPVPILEPLKNERVLILETLKKELKEYDDFILAHRQLRADPDPPLRNVKNIKKFFETRGWRQPDPVTQQPQRNHGPISDAESDFINKEGDLVSLVPKAKVPLRRFLERRWFMLIPYFQEESSQRHYHDAHSRETTHYQSEAKVNGVITVLTLGIGLALLLGPLWGLWKLDSLHTQTNNMILISCLIFVFISVLGGVMVSKPFETLGATAAYAAVLMVFLQISASNTTTNVYYINGTAPGIT